MSREWDYEESFHAKDRKASRKARKYAQTSDRSLFKKTDQNKKQAPAKVDPKWGRGRVVSFTGEGVWVDAHGDRFLASLKGILKKEKSQVKNILSVGDIVRFTADGSIAHIEERYSFLSRKDVSGKKEQLIAVNVDQAIITVSVVNTG